MYVPEAPQLGAEQSGSDKEKNNCNVYLYFLSLSVIQHQHQDCSQSGEETGISKCCMNEYIVAPIKVKFTPF